MVKDIQTLCWLSVKKQKGNKKQTKKKEKKLRIKDILWRTISIYIQCSMKNGRNLMWPRR